MRTDLFRLPLWTGLLLLAGFAATVAGGGFLLEGRMVPAALPLQLVLLDAAVWGMVTLLALTALLRSLRRNAAELRRLATYDTLTGCLNRHAFELVLQTFMRDAQRSQQPLSVILFDVDHFRQINGSAGLPAGDVVLQLVATLARANLRESDVIARWGDEEFMVLLNDCRQDMAVQLAENLRLCIATHDFSTITHAAVTVSLGVAQLGRNESETAFFNRLDEALRLARDNGRNRCEAAGVPA